MCSQSAFYMYSYQDRTRKLGLTHAEAHALKVTRVLHTPNSLATLSSAVCVIPKYMYDATSMKERALHTGQ